MDLQMLFLFFFPIIVQCYLINELLNEKKNYICYKYSVSQIFIKLTGT